MSDIATKKIKFQIGKAASILATLKNGSIVRNHGEKSIAETVQSRFSPRFFLFSACI